MNIGGDYYFIIFYKGKEIVDKKELLVYRKDVDSAASEYAEKYNIEYDKIDSTFLREQSGDEI